jgi:cyclopropane fatty-acyl-phospholipid synthase-like methyltransferase
VKSYDAAREHADFESEVERLRAQVELTWAQEANALSAFGLRAGMSVVDLGSGPGFTLARLLKWLPRSQLTGIELDPSLHARARASLRKRLGSP